MVNHSTEALKRTFKYIRNSKPIKEVMAFTSFGRIEQMIMTDEQAAKNLNNFFV